MARALHQLVTNKEEVLKGARALCLQASEEGFEGVVIIGKRADGRVTVWNSKGTKFIELIGALELAKHDLIAHSTD